MLAVIALGDAVRSRRALRAELARQSAAAAEDRRREAARQVEDVRVRIARELHDTLGHTMSVITLQSAGGSAMAELRATLGTLRSDPGSREPPPGLDRLTALADGVSRSGLPVDLRMTGDTGSLPAIVGTTAYRLVQEALTNALRHAEATLVTVTVEVTSAQLRLEVVDDGRGVPHGALAAGPGHGLRGMTERVALLGGAVHAGNAEGGGFRVGAHLPLTRTTA